jgi:DNA-binding transcriptional ArsR family regulator
VRERFHFGVALRFELWYALGVAADERGRVHSGWRSRARAELPRSFFEGVDELGGSSILWALAADALCDTPLELDGAQLAAVLARMDPVELARRMLTDLLHDPKAAAKALEGEPLPRLIAALPAKKREWLSHVDLFPVEDSPSVRMVRALIGSPARFRERLAQLVDQFWSRLFKKTWEALQPALERSRAERERLFQSCTLEEFARVALLRAQLDDSEIAAIRGGFRVAHDEVSAVFVLPSAFNDARYWSAYRKRDGKSEVYFPCFDPAISLDEVQSPVEPELDAALIFRALGEQTRFAMARLLARAPMTSAELAEKLGLTRPTVSHHVVLLREAGLLEETPQRGSVRLSLRRDRIASLSNLTLSQLYGGRT